MEWAIILFFVALFMWFTKFPQKTAFFLLRMAIVILYCHFHPTPDGYDVAIIFFLMNN